MRYSPCRLCGAEADQDDPDPCWGWLDGVAFACCGHGDLIISRYISTLNGRRFGGPAARAEYDEWLASPEGQAVGKLKMPDRFRLGWSTGRSVHRGCGMLYAEHTCRGRDGIPLWPHRGLEQ